VKFDDYRVQAHKAGSRVIITAVMGTTSPSAFLLSRSCCMSCPPIADGAAALVVWLRARRSYSVGGTQGRLGNLTRRNLTDANIRALSGPEGFVRSADQHSDSQFHLRDFANT